MTAEPDIRPDEGPWFADPATDEFLAGLDLAMPATEPPAGLWARIAPDLQPPQAAGPRVRLSEGRWRALAPGVEIKRLWDRDAYMLRCQPGAVVPPHEHRSFEHAVVISGDLQSEGEAFGPGDYLGTPPGGRHSAWTTRAGCVVLVTYG